MGPDRTGLIMLLDLFFVLFSFSFSVCPVWSTKLATRQLFYCTLNTQYHILLLLQMSWIRVLSSHSCGGTLQKSRFKLLHSSMQTSADHRSRRRHASRMTDEKGETWSPSGMSKVRSRPESLVADCPMHALQPPERRGRQG